MKAFIPSALLILAAMAGCSKDAGIAPQQSCDNEHVVASYQNREAVVTKTQWDTYCLIVDEPALSSGQYLLDNYLVPVHPLPAQYQVEGLRVLLTGRKKSCYGLTTLPTLRTMFGYKLEVDKLQAKQ
jgi:hypothetical protein